MYGWVFPQGICVQGYDSHAHLFDAPRLCLLFFRWWVTTRSTGLLFVIAFLFLFITFTRPLFSLSLAISRRCSPL